jgi:hypothetical protein
MRPAISSGKNSCFQRHLFLPHPVCCYTMTGYNTRLRAPAQLNL